MLLKVLSDFERIGDHATNLVESAAELHEKGLFSPLPPGTNWLSL